MPQLVATAVWTITPQLVLTLDAAFGSPVDSYVNGSQVWLNDTGPGDVALEWRLHPATGYRIPRGVSHYDVFEMVVATLSTDQPDAAAAAIALGSDTRPLTALWEGLECFCAYGDDIEPGPLATAAEAALGIAPTTFGLVDHDAIGAEFERTGGNVSLMGLLRSQLRS